MLIAGLVSLLALLKTRNVTLASVPLFVLLLLLGWVIHVAGVYIIYGMALPALVGLTHLSRVWKQVIYPA